MRRPLALLSLPLSALVLVGCGNSVSTAGFSGEKHEVAQSISNLQSAATASEPKKICAGQLASAIVTRLGGAKGCEAAIKSQLSEIDNLETTVESVQVAASADTATAQVKSIHEGKSALSTVTLVKQDGKWKIAGVTPAG